MGEVLNQVWLNSMKNKLMRILRKTSGVHASPRKVCDEMKETNKKKDDARVKMLFMAGSPL